MTYFGKLVSNFKEFCYEINPATLTGAIDVVVVEQPDGSFTCSPFHVRFGKLGVLRSRLKVVDLELNGEPLNIHMKLGDSGEAFFVEDVPEDELEASAHLATSPIPDTAFPPYQETGMPPRRNSADFSLDKYENQMSDYSHRRYTDGQEVQKTDFSAQKRDYQKIKEKLYDYVPPQTSQDPEPMFVMDDLDDTSEKCNSKSEQVPTSPTIGSAKTFRAEELSDKDSHAKDTVRKISINNDFKPISMTKDEPLLPTTTEIKQSAEDVNVQVLTEDPVKQQSNGSNKKKKKTKKSGSKKKNTQRKSSSSSNSNSSQSDPIGADVLESERTSDRNMTDQLSSMDDVTTCSAFNSKSLMTDMHFYSDTDIPKISARDEQGTPVQSDSELELSRGSKGVVGSPPGQSWRWGELPSPLPLQMPPAPNLKPALTALGLEDDQAKQETRDTVPVSSAAAGSSSSMLSGMFSFMKPGRGSAQASSSTATTEGLYLAELATGAIDPEVAALYFPPHDKEQAVRTSVQHNAAGTLAVDIIGAMATEEDYESGNGPSLPQSPSSVEGLMCKGIDSDEDDNKIFCKGFVGLSLCGPSCLEQPESALNEAFEKDAVRFEMLCSDPSLVHNPRLMVRMGDKFMPWTTAAPAIMSLIVYHRPLPKSVLESLPGGVSLQCDPKNEDRQNSKAQQRPAGYSWWNWRRSADKQTREETINDLAKTSADNADGNLTISEQDASPTSVEDKLTYTDMSQDIMGMEDSDMLRSQEVLTPQDECVAVSTQTSFVSGPAGEGYSGSQSSEDSDEGCTMDKGGAIQASTHAQHIKPYRKTLRLSSDQIASLNLREGMNEMVFSVTTAYQGTSRCKCHVFRWRHDDKIVISDIDGTITKSDVLGHIFPLVGKDWAQSGVAQLFTKIKNNGYKLLYLSARAIGQAKGTRDYLRSVKQGDLSLPDGPLLLNPTSLLRAFHREVIEKKPEEFKIQCLSDIMALFPEGCKPFYAGYGNRSNDVCAYEAVGIPIVRIFTINYKGELKHELTQTFQSSYSNMSYIVDHLFPPVRGDVCEDFSQFVYWREPIGTVPELLPTPTSVSAPAPALPSIPEGPADA